MTFFTPIIFLYLINHIPLCTISYLILSLCHQICYKSNGSFYSSKNTYVKCHSDFLNISVIFPQPLTKQLTFTVTVKHNVTLTFALSFIIQKFSYPPPPFYNVLFPFIDEVLLSIAVFFQIFPLTPISSFKNLL